MTQIVDSKYAVSTITVERILRFVIPYARTAYFLETKEEQMVFVNLGWNEISENQVSWLKVFIDDALYRMKESIEKDGKSLRLKNVHIRLHGGTFEIDKDLKNATVVKRGGLLLKITFPFSYIVDFKDDFSCLNMNFNGEESYLLKEDLLRMCFIQEITLFHKLCKRQRMGNKYYYIPRTVDKKEVKF